MKFSSYCLFCKQTLNKAKNFPNINHDPSYVMWCDVCPKQVARWNSPGVPNTIIYSYKITYLTENCVPENIYNVNFHIDELSVEFYLNPKKTSTWKCFYSI